MRIIDEPLGPPIRIGIAESSLMLSPSDGSSNSRWLSKRLRFTVCRKFLGNSERFNAG